MEIRKGTEADIPEIVNLLRISLGESMIPKSEMLWKWKHIDNPFGKSPVLVAEEGGKICGVRAFLRWDFIHHDSIIKACRAVDTAVHPDFQRRGIFKDLSLSLINQIHEDGIDLIYNTPNAYSAPGYIKMGWKKWGLLPLKVSLHFTLGKKNTDHKKASWDLVSHLIQRLESSFSGGSTGSTFLKPGYLAWRYIACPLFPYDYISDGKSYLLIYRLKDSKWGRELRVTDFFAFSQLSGQQKKEVSYQLTAIRKKAGVRFTTISGLISIKQNHLSIGYLPIVTNGPLITLRQVNPNLNPMKIGWHWSLGDLEVF